MSEKTGYSLSRSWFDFCFENPEKISPNHTALYFFTIEHCNRLGWKEKFGLPSGMAMDAIGIKSYKTYKKTLDDLVKFGFIKMVQKSKNQYSSNIVALVNFTKAHTKAHTKALTKAMLKHSSKHLPKQVQSKDSIYKPLTNKPDNNRARVRENLNNIGQPDFAGELFEVDGFAEVFLDYWCYLKETRGWWPNVNQVFEGYRSLVDLKNKRNDPVRVVRQTILARNVSFYDLREKQFGSKMRLVEDDRKIIDGGTW